MAPIALVNRVFTDPMLLNIISSFHGDYRVEIKMLSLKRDWLAHFQELVRPHREQVEDILVWSMHRVERFFHEKREAYWEDAADRAPAIALPDIHRDEHSSFWGPEASTSRRRRLRTWKRPSLMSHPRKWQMQVVTSTATRTAALGALSLSTSRRRRLRTWKCPSRNSRPRKTRRILRSWTDYRQSGSNG